MKGTPTASFYFIFALIIFSSGCAPFYKTVTRENITFPHACEIISSIKEQGDIISSFYSIGSVSIKGWILDSDADILVAGLRDPFALKIEITHPWGGPVLHILIRDGKINVLSFQEKLIYTGSFTPDALSRFLPGFTMDRDMIWSILSGRPPVVSHETVSISGPDRISLDDGDGREMEVFYMPPEGPFPVKVVFPRQSLNISFSELKEDATGLPYAGKIRLSGEDLERDLTLTMKKTALNASVPDNIFDLEIPSNYMTVNLDDLP